MVSDIEWVNMSWSFLGCVRRCVSVKYQIMSPMHLSDSNKIAWRKYCIMDILTHLRNSTPHNWKKNLPFTNLGTPACRRPLDPFGPTVGTFGFGAAFSSNLKNLMRISAAGCWCKWVIPMVTNGSVRLIHLVTGVKTYLLTGTSHQVSIYNVEDIFIYVLVNIVGTFWLVGPKVACHCFLFVNSVSAVFLLLLVGWLCQVRIRALHENSGHVVLHRPKWTVDRAAWRS